MYHARKVSGPVYVLEGVDGAFTAPDYVVDICRFTGPDYAVGIGRVTAPDYVVGLFNFSD
jgi:hypothetical protein